MAQILSGVVGVLFVLAAVAKGEGYPAFVDTFAAFLQPLPLTKELAAPLALALILFEVVLGYLLVVCPSRWVRVTAIATLAVFSLVLSRSIFGVGPSSCNCFGPSLGLPHWADRADFAIARNVVLIVLIAASFCTSALYSHLRASH